MDDPVVDTFLTVLRVVEDLALPYVVMGGIAVNAWGLPRTTFDVDLALDIGADALGPLYLRLDQAGLDVPEEYRRGYVERLKDLRLVKVHAYQGPARPVTVDLFLNATPFQESAFQRRVRVEALGRAFWVISAADLLLYKLMAWRPKDRLDIQNVLTIQGVPEPEYLRGWAARLGVGDRLREAIEEAGLTG